MVLRSTRTIMVEGEPRERGFQYGSLAKDLIQKNIETYKLQFKRFSGLDWKDVTADASKWAAMIEEYDSDIMDEIEGVASGAGRPIEEVVALNARYEFAISPLSGRVNRECTSFAATPDAASCDGVILGENWDFRSRFRESCILLFIKQSGGKPDILTHVEAGNVAHKGLNSSGLGLCINALLSDKDRIAPGVPLVSVVAREILNSKSIRDAVHAVAKARRSASINYMIAHSGGEAIDLEVIPDDIEVLHPQDGIITHSNNFLGNLGVKDLGKTVFPDSHIRWNRMRRLLLRRRRLNAETIRLVTSDHFDYPNSICRHPDPRAHPDDQFETITSVIMQLDRKKLHMTEGPPCTAKYETVPARLA
ncbi:hypothetical protein KEJ39_00370 [Candidatus Bathyarchaeota archaeon]|nr:hypothetical protein [Candidatus Bathyarchaeota archaeon]